MHPALALTILVSAHLAATRLHYSVRGVGMYGPAKMSKAFKKATGADIPCAVLFAKLLLTVALEEVSFRFGVPAILAQHGVSLDASREISSMLFGVVHLLNWFELKTTKVALAQQAIFALLMGRVLFDVNSILLCVFYHSACNAVSGTVLLLFMRAQQASKEQSPSTSSPDTNVWIPIDRSTSPGSYKFGIGGGRTVRGMAARTSMEMYTLQSDASYKYRESLRTKGTKIIDDSIFIDD